ncbi:MAG: hypothetical protein VW405_03830, partial [Rhodospirillaceae bacterium]
DSAARRVLHWGVQQATGVARMVSQTAVLNPDAPDAANPCVPSAIHFADIDVAGVSGRIDRSLANKVRKLVDDHPDRALEVIRGWMAEGYRH